MNVSNNPWKLLLFFMKPCKHKQILAVLFALLSVGGSIIPYASAYQIFAFFFNGVLTAEDVWTWTLIALVGFFIKVICHGISTTFAHISAYTILENIRNHIAEKLMKAPLGTVQNQSIGKLKNLLVDHVETIELPLAHVIPEGFAAFVLPIGVFSYLCFIDWRLALISLITLPLSIIPFIGGLKAFSSRYDNYMKTSDEMNSVIVEYVEGIEVIKAFNQTTSSYQKFSNSVKNFKATTLDWFKSTWAQRTFVLALLPATLIGVLPLGMYLYLTEGLSPTIILMAMLLSMGIVGCFMKFAMFLNLVKSIHYAMVTLQEVLTMEELPQVKERVEIKNHNISIENMSFSYGGIDGERVLHSINLQIKEGTFTSLVGPSGGGKSTIAKLIARFWDVTDGKITIGGVDIRKMPLSQLSELISFVTQDNFLFNISILENIRMGNPKATDGDVYTAAKSAMCDDFITQLDNGYQTLAGEAGGKLSGGERQRIAIARAILKNAPIVILDEATAFTDPENEANIHKSIAKLTKGKTLLVIAHRLSTIKNADSIVVLKQGNIDQIGTHHELLENCPLYTGMWNAHISTKSWIAGKREMKNV